MRRSIFCAALACALPALLALAPAGCAKPAAPPAPPPAPTQYTYDVVHTYPHDTNAFTEGLVYLDGQLYESTGLNGHSTLREVDLATGKVLREVDVPPEYFGEGIAILGGKIYQLTWQKQTGFIYDLDTFKLEKNFAYQGEGWGMTTDGHSLIMSNGTSEIRFLDPATFAVQRAITVKLQGQPADQINELEYIKGEIYANVWQTNQIYRIDPATGNVVGVIDLAGLLPLADRHLNTDVLNGIAYDAAGDRLFVTGKNWPKLFEIRLKPEVTRSSAAP